MLEHSMLYPKTTLTRRRISMDGILEDESLTRAEQEKFLGKMKRQSERKKAG